MNPPPSAEPSVKDLESLWLQHKDTLHRLYITENKTLVEVKYTMENGHKFPVLRLHDYEIALRELLKLRKNLKKEDWYSIGIHVSDRKRQGKESEVLWNNIPMTARKVRKDVLRNRKLNQLCDQSRITELPVGVVIRTPPSSPLGQAPVIAPPAGLRSGPEQVVPVYPHSDAKIYQVGSSSWDVRAAQFKPTHLDTPRFRHLRSNIPFNRFMSELLKLAESHPLIISMPAEWTWAPGPRMFGSNPSLDLLARVTFQLSNRLWTDWTTDGNSWFMHWLGVSADFAMLETFFSMKTPTVCAVYEELCRVTMRLGRLAAARVLLEMQDTVTKNNPIVADGINFLEIAVYIGSGSEGIVNVTKRALKPSALPCKRSHGNRVQCVPHLFALAAARRDIEMMRTLVEALGNCHDEFHDFYHSGPQIPRVMRQVYAWDLEELKVGHTLADYIQLLVQGGILLTALSKLCCYDDRPEVAVSSPKSIAIDELIMFCPPIRRKIIYSAVLRCSNEHRMFLNKAGVFTAALEGTQGLLDYLHSCKQNDAFEVRATMQECLLFAAALNDTQTASSLIQLGVDPEVGLLSNNQQCYHKGVSSWNPMIVAAAAGNLETLNLFKETIDVVAFLKSAPVHEIIHLESPFSYDPIRGTELRRLERLRLYLLVSQKTNPHAAVVNSTVRFHWMAAKNHTSPVRLAIAVKRRIETITWIWRFAAAHGIASSIGNEIIEAALFYDPDVFDLPCAEAVYDIYHPCDVLLLDGLVDGNLEYHEGDMDLLQLSIRAQCSLAVVELLLSKGLRVHSRAAAQSGNTMLHDALLGQSRDRSEIVHLLLRKGADYKHCGGELTILEASLHKSFARTELLILDYLKVFTHLFEAGAPVQHRPRPRPKDWQPLICRLIYATAEDDLIFRVVDAGADLNERGRIGVPGPHKSTRALSAAILDRREKLAQQLIQRGANVNAPAGDDEDCTALQAACLVGSSLGFVEYLVRVQGADVNEAPGECGGYTALQWAVSRGSLTLAEFLLDNGADVNALSGRVRCNGVFLRQRALDCAAKYGRLDMVEFLLKAGSRSASLGLGGAIEPAKRFEYFAVLSVLLEWEEQHGSRMMEEEAEWQRRHPDAAPLLPEP